MTLPKVTKDVLLGLSKYSSDKEMVLSWYEEIKKENPLLWKMIVVAAKSDKPDEWKDGYCKAAVQFYRLLYAQSECNDWEASKYLRGYRLKSDNSQINGDQE